MKKFVVVTALIACAASLISLASAQDIRSMAAGTRGGGANFMSEVREVNMSAIPQARPSEITPRMQMLRPRDGRTDAEFAAMKREAARLAESGNGNNGPLLNMGPAPAGGGSAFLHSPNAFFGQGEVCCTPSDMAIAVGPTYVAQFVNTYIAVYTKTGVLQSGYPKSATAFFGLPAGTYTTDPRGFYDWTWNRYVFVMLTESSFSSNNVGRLLIAISSTSNPTGSWHVFNWQVGGTGECPDYPTLGHDTVNWGKNGSKGAIYIGINQFGNNCNGGFINNYLFTIPKDKPYAGTGLSFWWYSGLNFGGTLVDTVQPSNPVSQGDRPAATYLTHTFNIAWGCNPCNGLGLWSINNSAAFTTGGPGPTLNGVFVPTAHNYYYPPAANQPGAAQSIETIDVRISGSMYYHAGDLWGSFDTGVPAVTGAHAIWFDYHPKLDVNGNIAGGDERSEDCFFCGGQGAGGSSYFATLSPDTENNVTMTYTFSSNDTYPEYVVTGRRVSYGDNLMNGAGYFLAGGSGLYSQFRWGDYSAVAPDNKKASNPLMWTAGDYDASGLWGTVISSQSYINPKDQ